MTQKLNPKESSQAIQSHLKIMQSTIARMAANSASSKTWCITLVSSILVIVADKNKPQYAFISLLPTFLFAMLDIYYLALEKGFRQAYKEFVRMQYSHIEPTQLYFIEPRGSFSTHLCEALRSFSVWPFYMTLLAMICIVRVVAR